MNYLVLITDAKVNTSFHIDKYYLHIVQYHCHFSQKHFAVVDAEDAAVADSAALAGCQYLDIAPAAVERVTE